MPAIDECELLTATIFEASLASMTSIVEDALADQISSGAFELHWSDLDLAAVDFGCPLRGGALKKIGVFYEPVLTEERCAFICNLSDGWHTLVNSLSKKSRINCVSVRSTSLKAAYPLTELRVFEKGLEVRVIRSMLDGDRWDFYESGIVRLFENTSHYRRKKIKDRLTRSIVFEYLRELGFDPLDEGYWAAKGPALYLRET